MITYWLDGLFAVLLGFFERRVCRFQISRSLANAPLRLRDCVTLHPALPGNHGGVAVGVGEAALRRFLCLQRRFKLHLKKVRRCYTASVCLHRDSVRYQRQWRCRTPHRVGSLA